MQKFTAMVAMAALSQTTSAEMTLADIDALGEMQSMFDTVNMADEDKYVKTYDEASDNSWDDCDLTSVKKEWKQKVLKTAQKFTNPELSQQKCEEIAKDLFDQVDNDTKDYLIDQCEATKEYIAFGNDPEEFKDTTKDKMPIKGYDFSLLKKFCTKKFKKE